MMKLFGSRYLTPLYVSTHMHTRTHTQTEDCDGTHKKRGERGFQRVVAGGKEMSSGPSRVLVARVVLVVITPGGGPALLHGADCPSLTHRLHFALVVLLVLLLHVVIVKVVVQKV